MIEIIFSLIISIIPFWLYWNYFIHTQKQYIPEGKEGILWLDMIVLPLIPMIVFVVFSDEIKYPNLYCIGYFFLYFGFFVFFKKTHQILKKHKPLIDFLIWLMSLCLCIISITHRYAIS